MNTTKYFCHNCIKKFSYQCCSYLTLPYFQGGQARPAHLPSAEAVSVRPNARLRM